MSALSKRQKAEKRGQISETMAALYLRAKGYRIVARRYKTRLGEIDIIARKGNTVAFIEVKARQTYDLALLSVTHKQRRRIENSAKIWLQTNQRDEASLRFDIIAVVPWRSPRHIKAAWRLGE